MILAIIFMFPWFWKQNTQFGKNPAAPFLFGVGVEKYDNSFCFFLKYFLNL